MVEFQPSKLVAWVRFPSLAPICAHSSVDRVPGYEPVGRRFESSWARQQKGTFGIQKFLFVYPSRRLGISSRLGRVYHQGHFSTLVSHHALACIFLRLDDIQHAVLMICHNKLWMIYTSWRDYKVFKSQTLWQYFLLTLKIKFDKIFILNERKDKMKFTFVPEYRFDVFSDASAEFLLSIGVKGIVLDIDNTLEPYENPTPRKEVLLWFDSLFKNGIKASIVSNNHRDRVELFNRQINIPAYHDAGKPFKKNILRAMADMGTTPEETILMGDQVFTDVWGAHNAKIRAILVPPIKDKTDLFTKFKRLLEIPVLKKYEKRKNI